MKTLYLKKNEDRRLRLGHLWIFSNEVDVARSPLKEFVPGEAARVADSHGGFVAMATVNPAALICGRIFSRDVAERLDADFLRQRLGRALELRQRLYDQPFYRLCFSEGDYLPGLTVDRYGDVLVAQLTTAGMDKARDAVVSALRELLAPRAILLKNDSPSRELEGLEREVTMALGEVPDDIRVPEGGVEFGVSLTQGQKTGWFYDQRDNRRIFASLAAGSRVLDAFSYVGAVGLTAVKAGADSALCLDASAPALERLSANAQGAGLAERVETRQGDAFESLAELVKAGERFGAVCIDPPALIKRKKDLEVGLAAYGKLNRMAMELVADGGVLMSCSCSQHLAEGDLRYMLTRTAAKAGVRLQLLHRGTQGPDHPAQPAMPETEYLKSLVVRVLK